MTAETVKENAILFGIIEEKKYTPADMEAFAEWCSESLYNYHKKHKVWVSYGMYRKVTTAQLLEMWEQSRKETT